MFEQVLERGHLRLEQGTKNVPDDGFYYLFHKDKLVGKYKSLKKAQQEFNKIESQYPPPKVDETPPDWKKILSNQLRTVSNNALLKGRRQPYRNPKKY